MVLKRQEKRIIVEGPDGAGKTILIENLMEKFHFLQYVRNSKGPDQDLTRWWPEQLDKAPNGFVPIHDRFFYSELVYGPILRGHITADPGVMHNVLWFLRMSALLIYCKPATYNTSTQTQMEGVVEHHKEIVDAYDELMAAEATFYPLGRFYPYNWYSDRHAKDVEEAVEKYLALPQSDGSTFGG